jgi:hypothetical protein
LATTEYHLKEIFVDLERYVMPLIGGDSPFGLSKKENEVLALQSINRLNQRIGFLARTNSALAENMRILQTYVNNLTIGLKSDNITQMKAALSSVRNTIISLESPESKL